MFDSVTRKLKAWMGRMEQTEMSNDIVHGAAEDRSNLGTHYKEHMLDRVEEADS